MVTVTGFKSTIPPRVHELMFRDRELFTCTLKCSRLCSRLVYMLFIVFKAGRPQFVSEVFLLQVDYFVLFC